MRTNTSPVTVVIVTASPMLRVSLPPLRFTPRSLYSPLLPVRRATTHPRSLQRSPSLLPPFLSLSVRVALFAYVRYTPTAYTGCGGENEEDGGNGTERIAKGGKARETARGVKREEGK